MAKNPKVGVGYNAQVAVDSKHKLIVEQPNGSKQSLTAATTRARISLPVKLPVLKLTSLGRSEALQCERDSFARRNSMVRSGTS
jgi:hypothetical protein